MLALRGDREAGRGGPTGDRGGGGRHTASLAARLALSVALVLVVGRNRGGAAAFAYGRQAAQQAFDRLMIGAANEIAGAISVQGGRVLVDIPASAFELLALAPDDRVLYAVFDPEGRARHRLRRRGAARGAASPPATSPASRCG